MSEQPEVAGIAPASPAALRDTRWLAGAMWGAALFAALLTSWAALGGAGATGDAGLFSLLLLGGGSGPGSDRDLAASASLIISAGIALMLIVVWWALSRATLGLIAALADSSDGPDDAPVPGMWLAQEGGRSALSDMATYLGVAWALIVLRPVVVVSIQVFTA